MSDRSFGGLLAAALLYLLMPATPVLAQITDLSDVLNNFGESMRRGASPGEQAQAQLEISRAMRELSNSLRQSRAQIARSTAAAIAASGLASAETRDSIEQTSRYIEQGINLMSAGDAQRAIDDFFDPLLEIFEGVVKDQDLQTYVARSDAEGMYYILSAASRGINAQAIASYGAEVYLLKGAAAIQLGDNAVARSALERAVELSPANSIYSVELAQLDLIEGDLTGSLQRYRESRELAERYSPESERSADLCLSMFGMGHVLVELGQYNDAASQYEECLDLDPENLLIERDLAYVHAIALRRPPSNVEIPKPPEAFEQGTANGRVIETALSAFGEMQEGLDARPMLNRLIESDDFGGISDTLKREVYLLLDRGESARRDVHGQYAAMRLVTDLPSSQPSDWISRMELAVSESELADASQSLLHLLQEWPESLSGLNPRYVDNMAKRALTELEDPSVYVALMDALLNANWQSRTTYSTINERWWAHALFLAGRGEYERAADFAGMITYTPLVIGMRADKRFDEVAAVAPHIFDIDNAIDREVEARSAAVTDDPGRLQYVVRLASALRRANRTQEALDLLSSARPAEPAPDTQTGWIDESAYLASYMNERADLLWLFGSRQNALGQLQEARTVFRPRESPNVNEAINLGIYYARNEQPARAREAVAGLEDRVSPYGAMSLHYVDLMAAIVEGDEKTIGRALSFMKKNSDDAPNLYQRVAIMAGELDAAADFLIERLQDEDSRREALVEIQYYLDDAEVADLKLDRLYAANKRQLLSRPDVKAAISKVGRVETYAVWHPSF